MGKIAMQYRELEENKVIMCRHLHNELHATEPPPETPSRAEMLEAIQRAMAGFAMQSVK